MQRRGGNGRGSDGANVYLEGEQEQGTHAHPSRSRVAGRQRESVALDWILMPNSRKFTGLIQNTKKYVFTLVLLLHVCVYEM